MRWKRVIARTVSEIRSLARGSSEWQPGFRVLLYHSVGGYLIKDPYGIRICPDLFEQHMVLLAECKGVNLVELRHGFAYRAGLRVAVTFDDGYKDNLHIAAPILLKHRIPFTVFATSSFIESRTPEYLSPEELRDLSKLPGAMIGSHGVTHRPFAQCDDETLWFELCESRRYLENVVGSPVRTISYPHGSVDLRVVNAVKRAGYMIGGCSRFMINSDERDSLLLGRSEIVATDSERVFLQKLRGDWDWRGLYSHA